jgi:outer membrane protein assembly factor BamD
MAMHKNKFFRNTLGMLASFVVFTGCSSDGPVIEQPEQQYYEIAQSRMRAKNYFSAIDALEMIVTRYPFGRYAEQAQSELIYAQFMNGDDEAAHAATEQFIRLHPRHPNIDYAYFMKGITSYTRDRSLFARFFEDNLPKRDISGAKQSFAELSEFLTRFPNSQYAPYAKQRLIYLRNMIAKHELVAARYYLKRKAYIAALRRAKYVIEHIPNSGENFEALNVIKESYENLGYLDLLEEVNKAIEINYPDEQSKSIDTESKGFWPFKRNAPEPVKQEL